MRSKEHVRFYRVDDPKEIYSRSCETQVAYINEELVKIKFLAGDPKLKALYKGRLFGLDRDLCAPIIHRYR